MISPGEIIWAENYSALYGSTWQGVHGTHPEIEKLTIKILNRDILVIVIRKAFALRAAVHASMDSSDFTAKKVKF